MKPVLLAGALRGLVFIFVVTLFVVIAVAADILTVDKDGTIRLRVSDQGKVTLNASDAAQGDMRFTPRTTDPTTPLAGDIWYNATDATMKAKAGTDIVNLPGRLNRYTITKSDGDFSTASTSWVDIPGLSLTFNTDFANQAILITVTARGYCNLAAGNGGNRIDINLDGTRLSNATYGLSGGRSGIANQSVNLSCSFMTVVGSAGSHTLKIQTFATTGETVTIKGEAATPANLQVLKFY